MASIVKSLSKKGKENPIDYSEVQVTGSDLEYGTNNTLLDDYQRYRNQDKFQSLPLQYEEQKINDYSYYHDEEFDEVEQIEVQSDAWPQPDKVEVKSEAHRIIRKQEGQLEKEKIYFKMLSGPDIEEVKNLHDEWFPLSYQENFYRRIYKSNVIAIGCFYPVEETDEQESRDSSISKKKEMILGTILTKIERDNDDITEIYRAKNMIDPWSIQSIFSSFSCRQYLGAYIMTIGVIDECRRFGIGSQLLQHTINILQQAWPSCEIIYLHVVDYNESAIKFYERNRFDQLRRIKNHYVIFQKQYDGLLLYKDIKLQYGTERPPPPNENWTYYDYLTFPFHYLREYYNRTLANNQ